MNESSNVSDFAILYEDNHVIAAFKPHGLLVQGDKTQDPSLLEVTKEWLKREKGKTGNVFLGLVHRLDRPAAGVVLFGRTSKGASRLSEQFREHSVTKTYRALVEGKMTSDRGNLVHTLDSDEAHSWLSETGKRAELNYKVLLQENDKTLVEIDLITGRKHQIRVQLSSIGHPIVGDKKYGATTLFRKPGQIALLAHSIEFDRVTEPKDRIRIEVGTEHDTLGEWS